MKQNWKVPPGSAFIKYYSSDRSFSPRDCTGDSPNQNTLEISTVRTLVLGSSCCALQIHSCWSVFLVNADIIRAGSNESKPPASLLQYQLKEERVYFTDVSEELPVCLHTEQCKHQNTPSF